MIRKSVSTLLIAALIFCLSGCGSNAGGTAKPEAGAKTEAAAEATTEQLSYEEVYSHIEAYVNEALDSTSAKKLEQDDDGNIAVFVAFSDGRATAKAAREGDADSIETWKNLTDTFTTIGTDCYNYLKEHGYGDRYIGICMANDQNTDQYLLLCKNDEIIYDIVNGIGVKEGDEDSLDDTFKEGESFKVGNLEITMTEKKLGYEPDDPYGFHSLPDGYQFLRCKWTYKNVGDTETYCSVYDFKCYADDQECEQDYFDTDFINSNLGSGRKVDFVTYYKVPKNAKSIELEYSTLLGTGKNAIVKVK